ncbi:MAG: Zn-dependent hydrolase [Chlorobi bacterium]|nr:Zn-dependent hydrolase [Chlorobiota bacterium]
MKPNRSLIKILLIALLILFFGCDTQQKEQVNNKNENNKDVLSNYVEVELKADLHHLSQKEKTIIPLLIQAADVIDDIYWTQSIGMKERILDSISNNDLKQYALINYGTWDRLNGMKPFNDKFGIRPLGARFYPAYMSYSDFDAMQAIDKYDSYTLIRKKNDGSLYTIPYHEAYKNKIKQIADLLNKASESAQDEYFKKYLYLRAQDFLTDNYYESDMAWMDNTISNIDVIIGPIEYAEDLLFHAKAAEGALILIKDKEWSKKLKKSKEFLPKLQKLLPINEKYKTEAPLTSADLGVYNVIYCKGEFNAGSKKISITLPYDGRVQMEKGSRKLQFKNVMKAKFDKILLPIANIVIDEKQRKNVNFNAFFENTMYYEVGNCLGCRNTINKKGTVKEALKEYYFAMEESKSDILSLYFITKLHEMQIFTEKDLMDNYVTYLADIFRSIRFGAANDQAKANIVRFNYFLENGAISVNKNSGTYLVNEIKMKETIENFAGEILKIRGDGNYDAAKQLITDKGYINSSLQNDIDKITKAGIPKDVYFKQGLNVLGLETK